MTEIIFVALVLESSLALASEWPHIHTDYIAPLLRRLRDRQTSNFGLSLVGYATADTRPSPILQKVPFTSLTQMLDKMRQPHELGIGQTGSGGGYGMAALEGIVAALEVCSVLGSSVSLPLLLEMPCFLNFRFLLCLCSPQESCIASEDCLLQPGSRRV